MTTPSDRHESPLVVACLRHIDQRPTVDGLTGEVHRDPLVATASAADQAALEHALRIAEVWDGRVIAVAAGPPAVEFTLRLAASVGAQPLRVPWPPASAHLRDRGATATPDELLGSPRAYLEDLAWDERSLARAIAAAIRSVDVPALVLCGDRATDRGTGALPAFLAHELSAVQALGLVALEVDGATVIAERRLDAGRRERLRVPRPAVCSVEAAGVRLRRAPLSAALTADEAPIPVAAPSGAAGAGTARSVRVVRAAAYRPRTKVAPPPGGQPPHDRLVALTGALVEHSPPTVVGPIDASGAADALLEFLARHGYLDTEAKDPATTPVAPAMRPATP